jgi:hypothetical protein
VYSAQNWGSFIPVFNRYTRKLSILRHYTYIVYISISMLIWNVISVKRYIKLLTFFVNRKWTDLWQVQTRLPKVNRLWQVQTRLPKVNRLKYKQWNLSSETWIKQNPVYTAPWIKQNPVYTEPWIKQNPV